MRTVVLVEGVTDELAVTLAARRLGRDLDAEGIRVVPIHGAHAMSRVLEGLPADVRVAGLYDVGEEAVIRRAVERAGHDIAGFFACSADLEDELIRAAGVELMTHLIELAGDSQPWHTFRRQQAWQGRPADRQLHRFIRSVSERNSRYVRAIVEALDPAELPLPLRRLLDYVRPT